MGSAQCWVLNEMVFYQLSLNDLVWIYLDYLILVFSMVKNRINVLVVD